jgi:hypothetical protein
MKLNSANKNMENTGVRTAFKNNCLQSCQKVLAQIAKAREAIFAESRDALKSHERLLRLALNEAEALAWQTMYPHLVFPLLAAEKIQAVADWNIHQQLVRQPNPIIALAA